MEEYNRTEYFPNALYNRGLIKVTLKAQLSAIDHVSLFAHIDCFRL